MSAPTQKHVLNQVFCVLYLRISLDSSGKRLGVKRQRKACLAIAKARGWIVVAEYVDNSISAYDRTKRRPGYEQMRADYLDGQFSAIVCWDQDRLVRQVRQMEDWIEDAEERGLLLVTADGDTDLTTISGRKQARAKVADARAEMEKKGARQRLAARQRTVKRGKLYGGTRLTGYTSKGKLLPDEAALVERIFQMFINGETITGIVRTLNEGEVPTRLGNPWSTSTITGMLKNPKYAGRQVYKGTVTKKPGKWKPIIESDDFDFAQTKFANPDRKYSRQGTERKYVGSGLFLCGVCRKPLQTYGQGPTYGCRGHGYKSVKNVDAIVIRAVIDRLAQPDVVSMLTPRNDARVNALADRLASLQRRIETTEADYDNEVIDGARYQAKKAKLVVEMEAVQRERARLMAGTTVGNLLTAPQPGQRFLDASVAVKKAVIEALMWVVLIPNEPGDKKFHSNTVSIRWRRTALLDGPNHTVIPMPMVQHQDVRALA